MATEYPAGFEPIQTPSYPVGFEPVAAASAPVKNDAAQFPRMGVIPGRTTFQKLIADPAAAISFGGLQALGRIPGETAASIPGFASTVVGGQPMALAQLVAGALRKAAPQSEILNAPKDLAEEFQAAIAPLQDLTPKAFEAAGVPTNFPTSPQFLNPLLAAGGEIFVPPAVAAPAQAARGVAAIPKAIASSLSTPQTEQAIARTLRAAAKPPKQLGARFEKATEESISDIFNHNPNADQVGSMPLEGFQQTVASLKKQVGTEISDAAERSGLKVAGGDEIAQALLERAKRMERAGDPAANVQAVRDRAADLAGKADSWDSLQDTVTSANRQLTPLFQRSAEMANPMRAQADTIANEIIAKTGGDVLNRILESSSGPEGAKLRKRWSNLTLIEKQASDQLNKIINAAPPEIQSNLASALTSVEGVAGIVGLLNGYASGIIPVASSAAKAWARNANKALRDSNALVTKAYEGLRANPPARPTRGPTVMPSAPPIIEDFLNMMIAKDIKTRQPGQPVSGYDVMDAQLKDQLMAAQSKANALAYLEKLKNLRDPPLGVPGDAFGQPYSGPILPEVIQGIPGSKLGPIGFQEAPRSTAGMIQVDPRQTELLKKLAEALQAREQYY